MELVGYHGTSYEASRNIVENGYVFSKEKEWLGTGIYFFKDCMSPYCSGFEEAKCWAKFVKKYNNWVVFKAKIVSEEILDLVDNVEHRIILDRIIETAKKKHKASSRRKEPFEDYMVFKEMDSNEETKVEVVICLVDAGNIGYKSKIVRRPQVQVCVKSHDVIVENKIAGEMNE